MYINLNYKNPDITLTTISNYCSINPCHLSELFHKKLGLTLKQYINFLRVNYAKKQLRLTEDSVTTICYDSGFSSISSFNRNFLALVGTTPLNYKNTIPLNRYHK